MGITHAWKGAGRKHIEEYVVRIVCWFLPQMTLWVTGREGELVCSIWYSVSIASVFTKSTELHLCRAKRSKNVHA